MQRKYTSKRIRILDCRVCNEEFNTNKKTQLCSLKCAQLALDVAIARRIIAGYYKTSYNR